MKQKTAKTAKTPLKKSEKSQKVLVENSTKKVSRRGTADKPNINAGAKKININNTINKKSRANAILTTGGVLCTVGGMALGAAGFLLEPSTSVFGGLFSDSSKKADATEDNNVYSKLTGLPLKSPEEVQAPSYCVQIPNGMDGARPQAGLNQAGVVYEAIAESGITRFAAVYQNPTTAVIGPIRSLRIYYLEWDTPYDCTIVHAGGSGDALAAVSRGYKDLTEDYTYMYRGSYGWRAWNNLFTTSYFLSEMSKSRGFTSSDIQGFSRMTPKESLTARVDELAEEKLKITEPSSGKTSNLNAKVSSIAINFGGYADFNVRYNYDPAENRYLRSYASGTVHDVYNCPDENLGIVDPEGNCELKQLAPSVVIAMKVAETKASDNYHEDITTTGSGEAYIFQNGSVITGTWKRASINEQIKFYDEGGTEIKLAPGQTFVEAVPSYGSVEYSS